MRISGIDRAWSLTGVSKRDGATSRLRYARRNPEASDWATRLLARRPFKVVAVALANKMARIAWALLARGGTYTASAAA